MRKKIDIFAVAIASLLSCGSVSAQELAIFKKVQLRGGTVFTLGEIEAIAAPYLNRPVDFDELLLLQQKLTEAYVERGHFTSFVTFEGQTGDGTLIFTAVEGTAKVEVQASGIRKDYIESKLDRFLEPPLDQERLEEGLNLLQRDPLVKDLRVAVEPTDREGESLVSVNVRSAPPWAVGVEVSNDENPAVGAWGIRGFLENSSFAGGGEQFRAEYKVTEGLQRWLVGISLPLPPTGSRVDLTYQQGDSEIVDGFFEGFGVKNDSYVASFRFRQPIWQKVGENFDFSFGVDRRESRSYALGEELSQVRLTAVRLEQSYFSRTDGGLGIALSQFSIGLSDQEADPTFFSWQGQGQYLYDFGAGQLFARLALQLSPNRLPAIEQCAIGGRNGNQFIFGNIVRGYTTNARLGDSCAAASLEVRFPVYRGYGWEVAAFPFLDAGRVWNVSGREVQPQTLIGTGFGVRVSYRDALLLQTNYGFALNGADSPLEDINQGLSFSILGQFKF